MNSEDTLRRIQADVEEAYSLGLHFTPMIFVNGVELKGWNAKNAVARAVAALAARNPPAMRGEHDSPPRALEKYLADWREQPVRAVPPRLHVWPRGSEDAMVKVVLFGDYQEPFTAEADRIIAAAIAGEAGIQYSFRHYPFNSECNPNVKTARHPLACMASRAAEAAGIFGGRDGYWTMHEWLMSNQKRFAETVLRQAVTEMGFNADAFFEAMKGADVNTGISGTSARASRWG
jgi:protein-disulfide isomerase